MFSTAVLVNTAGPLVLTADWAGIDTLTFVSSGGEGHPFGVNATHFAIDNLNLESPTPEPSAWLLAVLGFGALGARLRRVALTSNGGAKRKAPRRAS